jgi:hypothetical protein
VPINDEIDGKPTWPNRYIDRETTNFFRPMGHGELIAEANVIEAGSFRWVPYFATGRQTL